MDDKGRQECVAYADHASLKVWYSETQGRSDSHCHSAVEIVVPVRGEVLCRAADGAYRVRSDEALILPSNCVHSLWMGEACARYLLVFEPDALYGMRDMRLIEPMLRAPLHLCGRPELQDAVRTLLMRCVACYEKKGAMWNAMCYAYLMQAYARLGQSSAARSPLIREVARRSDPEALDDARAYIDQNFKGNISLEDVSAFTGFSKYYFSRVFKRQMGVSFSEYLRGKRVAMAEELLVHSHQSIQDIAMAVGFGSIATFNRVFREARNCTPSRYREIYGED